MSGAVKKELIHLQHSFIQLTYFKIFFPSDVYIVYARLLDSLWYTPLKTSNFLRINHTFVTPQNQPKFAKNMFMFCFVKKSILPLKARLKSIWWLGALPGLVNCLDDLNDLNDYMSIFIFENTKHAQSNEAMNSPVLILSIHRDYYWLH